MSQGLEDAREGIMSDWLALVSFFAINDMNN